MNLILSGGAAPKPPGFSAFRDQSMEVINERPYPSSTALHTSVTRAGARVAPQRCPILRKGVYILSQFY